MAGEWIETTIGEIADVVGGSTPSTKDPANFDGHIPWLTPKDLSGPHRRYVERGERNLSEQGLRGCSAQLLPKNSVLLSSRAPIGYVAIAANPIATNQGFRSLVVKPEYHHEFLFYWLTANVDELERHASGSTFKELSGTSLKKIRIRLPAGREEQRAIAHILGTLDDKIELNRRMSETLEAIARAIFKAWFVDFEPVRAKMEGRWRRGESHPGLPAHFYDLFPDRLVESELGEIPEGWEIKPFADTVEIIGGGTPKTSVAEYWNGDIPWFSVVDAPGEHQVWVIDTEKKITRAGIDNSSTKILPVGTTIISARGTVGRVALVGVPMAMNQYCYGLRGRWGRWGLFNYIETRQLVSILRQRTHGSVFDTITRDTLATVHVAVPSVATVEAFEEEVKPILDRIREALVESRTLATLRDALLPKLISGELRVTDAERFLEERGL